MLLHFSPSSQNDSKHTFKPLTALLLSVSVCLSLSLSVTLSSLWNTYNHTKMFKHVTLLFVPLLYKLFLHLVCVLFVFYCVATFFHTHDLCWDTFVFIFLFLSLFCFLLYYLLFLNCFPLSSLFQQYYLNIFEIVPQFLMFYLSN